ncbi:MAG: papain-like cysteine protease family protein [Clostridiaceae bacterium]|nr:papain-like cysteine protease family protein [Clostridiaceae bacterium]
MKKKIMCLCFAVVFVFSISVPVFAENVSSSAVTVFEEQVSSLTHDVLKFMEPEKELYGLGDIDFSSLFIGEEIPAYILTDAGMIVETNILYFPIMSDNIWVATSIVSYDSAGEMNVQISTEYAKAYEAVDTFSTEVALLFDNNAAYIYTDTGVTQAAISPNEISGRVSIKDYDATLTPMTAPLSSQRTLSVRVDSERNSRTTRSFDNQKYLSVPGVRQAAGSLQCWAASIASIRGYYGTTTSIDNVYNFSGITKYLGANIYTAADVLEDYGFNLTWYWNGSFNWYQLRTEIYYNESPFFVACSYSNSSGHAVVLRGYYVYENISQVGIISYMDPVTGNYAASSVATDGDFYYVPSGSSSQYTMNGFLAVAN